MKVTLIAATNEQARHAAVKLDLVKLGSANLRMVTQPDHLQGLSRRPGELFIVVQAPRLALTWQARKDWQQVLDDMRARQLPLLEYTLP